MKTIVRGVAIAAATFLSGTAYAGTASSNLNVSATVSPSCTVSSTAVAFGSVDPLASGNVDATGGLSVTCTNGTAWVAKASAGGGTGATAAVRKMTIASGTETLNYSLYTNSARSTVWGSATGQTIGNTGSGSAQSVTIYGRVPSGQTSAKPGEYSDVVQVSVEY